MELKPRHVFLKIEPLRSYSPLAPEICSRRYGRDCMYNEGHELGRVSADEIRAASLDGLVYREYLDPDFKVPNTAKIIAADVNEPAWDRRIPGAVLYAKPGERLHIHVLNGDTQDCHSFHVHGVRYGIDSDGAWPFGVASRDGRRSDEILPGQTWTYIFEATQETIGAWPFHDHCRTIQRNVNLGLFGGLVVRDPHAPCPAHEIPLFVHQLQAASAGFTFRSPELGEGQRFEIKPADQVLDRAGTVNYFCLIHGAAMSGVINILPHDPMQPPAIRTVTIQNLSFGPPITIRVGDTVRWVNAERVPHIVFSAGGGQATFCLNGRAYVGNTPTIDCEAGDRLRWYVFNLDVGSVWHNFHPHSVRWQLPEPSGGAADVHSLSPVESFVTETVAPRAVRLPCDLERLQCDPPPGACRVRIKGEFLFHCHVEEHMMLGLAGLVRSREHVWITEEIARGLPIELPYDDGRNSCPRVDLLRCKRADEPQHPHHSADGHSTGSGISGTHKSPAIDLAKAATEGAWELLPCDSQVLAVHAAMLHTGKVLFIAGSGNSVPNFQAHKFRAVLWDYERGGFKALQAPTDLFCAGHSFLVDGRLLLAGGTLDYASGRPEDHNERGFRGEYAAYIFDPLLEDFIRVTSMHDGRWYPTLITLADGRILTVSGLSATLQPPSNGNQPSKINEEHELFSTSSNWSLHGAIRVRDATWPLYPHLFVVPKGLFYTGGHVFGSNGLSPGFLDLGTNQFTPLTMTPAQKASFNLDFRDQSASVLLPPAQMQQLMIMGGGGVSGGGGNPETAIDKVHILDVAGATTTVNAANSMHRARMHLNAVLLPDRTVLVSGGEKKSEVASEAALEAEIYNPATDRWTLAAKASVPRMYHSIALLLPDGRVITAGSNPESADPGGGELRLELYHPPYLFKEPRPILFDIPRHVHMGESFRIESPQARGIRWISLIRPMATTHSWDSNQRLVDVPFETSSFCSLRATMPRDPAIVPPGWYMLFLTDTRGVPSIGRFVQVAEPHR